MKTHYEILNISKDSSPDVIKRAYFSLVKKHSPEKDPEGFQKIRQAYDILSNEHTRKSYDQLIDIPSEYQSELLEVYELLKNAKYKQAIESLKKLDKLYKNELQINKLLAKVYVLNGNTVTAIKLLEGLFKLNPNDQELAFWIATTCAVRGHNMKAIDWFEKSIAINPQDLNSWTAYIKYCFMDHKYRVVQLFDRVDEISPTILKDEYFIYLLAAYANLDSFSGNGEEKALKYFELCVDYYLVDKYIDIEKYENMIEAMSHFSSLPNFVPTISNLFKSMDESGFKQSYHSEKLDEIKKNISLSEFLKDDKIHDVLKDLTKLLTKNCDSTDCRISKLDMELYIMDSINKLRKSIQHLRDEYPDLYALNQSFYVQVLTQRKLDHLMDKHYSECKKLSKKQSKNSGVMIPEAIKQMLESFDDDDFETPFVRESPKIGRNDPCPCKSGKKYKHCCGA